MVSGITDNINYIGKAQSVSLLTELSGISDSNNLHFELRFRLRYELRNPKEGETVLSPTLFISSVGINSTGLNTLFYCVNDGPQFKHLWQHHS